MKADCPRALESCIMKLASRTSGQRGWWGRAQSCWKRQGLPWGKQIPGSSQAAARQVGDGLRRRAGGHSTACPGKLSCPKATPPSFGAALTETRNGCKGGWGGGHSTDASPAAPRLSCCAAGRKGRSCVSAGIAPGRSCLLCSQILHKDSVWHSGKIYPDTQQW